MAWNDLTVRKQSLDRAIDSCDISLDGSIACPEECDENNRS